MSSMFCNNYFKLFLLVLIEILKLCMAGSTAREVYSSTISKELIKFLIQLGYGKKRVI